MIKSPLTRIELVRYANKYINSLENPQIKQDWYKQAIPKGATYDDILTIVKNDNKFAEIMDLYDCFYNLSLM